MAWKPRLPVKTVDQAMAAVLPMLPAVDIPPRSLETDEDVVALCDEMRRQDPRLDKKRPT